MVPGYLRSLVLQYPHPRPHSVTSCVRSSPSARRIDLETSPYLFTLSLFSQRSIVVLTAITLSPPSPLQREYALVVTVVLVAFLTLFFCFSPTSSTVVEFLLPKSFLRCPIHPLRATPQNVISPVFRFLQDFPAPFPRSHLSFSLQASYVSLRLSHLRLNLSRAHLRPPQISCLAPCRAVLILQTSLIFSSRLPYTVQVHPTRSHNQRSTYFLRSLSPVHRSPILSLFRSCSGLSCSL